MSESMSETHIEVLPGTKIQFIKDVACIYEGDHPIGVFAFSGDFGYITEQNSFGSYWVTSPRYPYSFGATLGTDFVKL